MKISRNGIDWGEIQTTRDGSQIVFQASGMPAEQGEILRVWGMRDGAQPLLIGVAEPDGSQLAVYRCMSQQYLTSLGYWPKLPEYYEAGVLPPAGKSLLQNTAILDPLLNQVMQNKNITVQKNADVIVLSCTFAPDHEFPLAFACCFCAISDGQAKLLWDSKSGRPIWTTAEI